MPSATSGVEEGEEVVGGSAVCSGTPTEDTTVLFGHSTSSNAGSPAAFVTVCRPSSVHRPRGGGDTRKVRSGVEAPSRGNFTGRDWVGKWRTGHADSRHTWVNRGSFRHAATPGRVRRCSRVESGKKGYHGEIGKRTKFKGRLFVPRSKQPNKKQKKPGEHTKNKETAKWIQKRQRPYAKQGYHNNSFSDSTRWLLHKSTPHHTHLLAAPLDDEAPPVHHRNERHRAAGGGPLVAGLEHLAFRQELLAQLRLGVPLPVEPGPLWVANPEKISPGLAEDRDTGQGGHHKQVFP